MAWLMKRGSVYYIRYCVGSKKRKVSTDTENFQLAKEKLRQFEAAQARGDLSPLPTKTPIADVLTAYVAHIRATKTAKSAQTDVYYLRDAFGPICDAVKVTSRKLSAKAKKRPPKPGQVYVSRYAREPTIPPQGGDPDQRVAWESSRCRRCGLSTTSSPTGCKRRSTKTLCPRSWAA